MAITEYDDASSLQRTTKGHNVIIINDFAIIPSSSPTFADNIRLFLRCYAEKKDYTIDGNSVFCVFLSSQASGLVFPLFVIEELISRHSTNPFCDFCRCAGWGHHYVTKRKYHFIITKSEEWKKPLMSLKLLRSHHLMHGLIHCNGFGHLLSINSSEDVSGQQIMLLWDTLCSTLHTRKISLVDISRKKSMDLRLLHGVAYARPWFGKWGYKFSNGSFGIKEEQYIRAIRILSSIEVDKVMEDFSGTRKEKVMKMIISFYRELSNTPLDTLSELLQYMLAFGSKSPIERKTAMALLAMSLNPILEDDNTEVYSTPDQQSDDNIRNDSGTDTTGLDADQEEDTTMVNIIKHPVYDSFDALAKGECSRWSGRRLNDAAKAVLQVFEERKCTMARHELREAVRNSIGDTGLIDFLLKHIDKVLIGDQIVQRFTNPKSRMLHFSLQVTLNSQALLDQGPKNKKKLKRHREANEWKSTTPGLNSYKDIFYLYQNILFSFPDSDIYSNASEVILNCKSFVKEWPLQEQNCISFQVLPNHEELRRHYTRQLPPGELVAVPQNATIKELKSAAEKALRDNYCIMENFRVLEVKNKEFERLDDASEVGRLKTEFIVTGSRLDLGTELRYEGGLDEGIVECKCGAEDDDGERMVACGACKVWQHTLCNSIQDDEDVPLVFLCSKCYGNNLRSKKRSLAIR